MLKHAWEAPFTARRRDSAAEPAFQGRNHRVIGLSALFWIGCTPQPNPVLTEQQSGTTALLQAVSPVNERVVWVSGHRGTYARTLDGGATWHAGVVPGADSLQFRDVHAVSADTAYLLAAGPGDRSRIYKTTDAGVTWQLQFRNTDSSAFYDCFDFWDATHGVAFSDAVAGEFVIRITADGERWDRVPADRIQPQPGEGEGAFAASGTCVIARPPGHGWIGTGAGGAGRVLHTANRGVTWELVGVPFPTGTPTSGIITLAFRDTLRAIAMGGDLAQQDAFTDNVLVTVDGGRSWSVAGRPTFAGAIYGSAAVPDAPWPAVVAVGPKGAAFSIDWGHTWTALSPESYWAVGFAGPRAGWAVGPDGRITRISLH